MGVVVGDILNWLACALLFPLMALPLAALASNARLQSSGLFLVIVFAITGVGALFIGLVPALTLSASAISIGIFVSAVIAIATLVYIAGGAALAAAKLGALARAITQTAGRTVMWLLLVMALVQFAIVLLRYVFGVNWIFMQESVTYMHGIVFLVAAGYALITDDHVRVDIIYRGASEKRKALTNLIGTYFALFPICLLILWASSPYVARSWAVFEGSTDTSGIQGVFLLKSLIPTFAVLMALGGFSIAQSAASTLSGRDS